MFGKIIDINENHVYVENLQKTLLANLKGLHFKIKKD